MYHRKEKASEQDVTRFLYEESEKGRLITEFSLDLKGPKYKDFFEKFEPESVKQFIQAYSIKKTQYLRHAPQFKLEQENNISESVAEAMELLWEIQQKKLFNLQCLWRAEKIHIPGITVTYDFIYWEKNISECPFLEPILNDEVTLYIEYLNSDFYSDHNPLHDWQDYDGFISEPHDEGYIPMPAWYSFYDSRMNNESLLVLNDIRGEKEKRYLSEQNSRFEENDYLQEFEEQLSVKPRLDIYSPGVLQDFIRRFENRKLMDFCVTYETELKKSNEHRKVEAAIEILKRAGEPIIIEASADWQTAIIHAAWKYEIQQTEQNVQLAYQEYLLRKENGIAQLPSKLAAQEELYAERLEVYKQGIVKARRALNEEGNLEF